MKPLQLDDIAALDIAVTEERGGRPLELALGDIDEDPAQPRSEFSAESLQELADSIAARGVLQPVSVRRQSDRPGRWMLNFGARRLRASRLAGKRTIPAFEDEGADCYDQVIENEQRERLRPLDLALFIQRRQALGESQAEIARRMSRSRNYVMVASALIDAPDWLLAVYREGRCRSMNALHELRKMHAEDSVRVEAWAEGRGAISRDMLQELRVALAEREPSAAGVALAAAAASDSSQVPAAEVKPPRHAEPSTTQSAPAIPADRMVGAMARQDSSAERQAASGAAPARGRRLQATWDGAAVWVVTDSAPGDPGTVFVQHLGQTTRMQVQAAQLVLVGWRAG